MYFVILHFKEVKNDLKVCKYLLKWATLRSTSWFPPFFISCIIIIIIMFHSPLTTFFGWWWRIKDIISWRKDLNLSHVIIAVGVITPITRQKDYIWCKELLKDFYASFNALIYVESKEYKRRNGRKVYKVQKPTNSTSFYDISINIINILILT